MGAIGDGEFVKCMSLISFLTGVSNHNDWSLGANETYYFSSRAIFMWINFFINIKLKKINKQTNTESNFS